MEPRRPEDKGGGQRLPANAGCGCILPMSGIVLVLLTAALAFVLMDRTSGFSPLWLVLLPLVLGIILLFVRVRISR